MKFAILLTCHNREEKTILCLESAQKALKSCIKDILWHYYITDDACEDNTFERIKTVIPDNQLTVIKADGNAFWAGGMRMAWSRALADGVWDYFLLLNDDTFLFENCIDQLLYVDDYSKRKYNKTGVYCGFVGDPDCPSNITYGAKKYKSFSILSKAIDLQPNGIPQECIMPNANVLLVSNDVVEKIGILDKIFTHGAADWDYGIRAFRKGLPVLTTCRICGTCAFDHDSTQKEFIKVKNMTMKERYLFYRRPTGFYTDGVKFFFRYNKLKYILLKLSLIINVLTPMLYYSLLKERGHK